ncbi:excisionase family DNA binding protein [Deinococcus metalli]|uniref:Excisionase family DNA binding protein n=1 Tax=Deinococcus metalli TaxID=1141878 RepID=A0A7W8KJR3_9DEIO|nr:helix-turn-helix domain-containing protein [Deinococcus metalli]MBB5379200.1 excisionase family DNA binding protein [Deinococcus metalli]GHF65159.1 hypothetical protein GCM10017781_46120 [Deinococcus metalli]
MIIDLAEMEKRIAQHVALLLEESIGDDILTVTQAAVLLQLHANTIRGMAARGELPGHKFGDSWRFRRSALLNHVSESRHGRNWDD